MLIIKNINFFLLNSVQLSRSVVSDSVTPQTAARQASLSITNSWSVLKLILGTGDAIQPSHPLLFPSPPAFNLSQRQGLLQWGGSSNQVGTVLEIQFQHQSSGLVSFRTDWFDLLAVHGIFKLRLQHHSSKSSIIPCLAFLYGPTFTSIYDYWKNHSFD